MGYAEASENEGAIMKTGCVILAGGKSSRMGTDKALLPLGEKNFIEVLTEEFDFFEEKIINSGNGDKIRNVTWPVIADVYPYHGPIGGLHAALGSCRSETLFCAACDTPLLKKEAYRILKSQMTEEDDAVIAVTEDGRIHPLCGIYKKQVAEIMEEQMLSDNNRMMHLLKRIRVRYVELNSREYGILNINTPEEYARFIQG